MKKITFFIALFCTSLFSSGVDKAKFIKGEQIYKETCISCHGLDGKSSTGMNLVVKPRNLTQTILNQNQIYKVIQKGSHNWGSKSDIMPSFESIYDKDELSDIALYVYEKFSKEQQNNFKNLLKSSNNNDKISLNLGEKIFKRNCKFCHGSEGKGDGVATTSPVDSIFPYDLTKTLLTRKQIFLYVKYGGKHFGTDKTDMPSWKKKYNDFRLRSIARYIDEVIRKKD